tara:strand:- start:3646 stop:4719 length:1074 start_codon:yes stop_codon:yes gene_type:complete
MKMEISHYNLDPERIQQILEELGYNLTDRGQYWQSNAVYRNGSNNTALQIWKNSGVWRDFVEGTMPLPFVKLLEAHLGTNNKDVLKKYMTLEHKPTEKIPAQEDRIVMEKLYDTEILEDLFPHYDFYNRKGIDSAILEFLKGGLATKGKMYQRFVFPIYNEHSQIHGFSGRDMSSRDGPKWKHMGRKSGWIYPYYVPDHKIFPVQEAIQESSSVILVESIGDLLNLHQHGFKNVLVSFGLELSPKILCHLMSLNVKKIIISFNNDSHKSINRGARAAVKNYLKLMNHFDFEQIRICLPTKNDFGDMTSEDFEDWQGKCDYSPTDRAKSILDFANKMNNSNDLPKNLVKNIKILKKYV